jgi:hypothetical protein
MSASGQAAGGGDAGSNGGGGEAAASGFDASALQAQLQQTAGGVDELRQQFGQFLESAPWQPQEAEAEDPGLDLSFLDQGLYNDPAYGEQERQQAQQLTAQSIQDAIDRRAQEAIGPLQEQLQSFQRDQQIRDLIGTHPEMQDPQIAEQVVRDARDVAEEMGRPDLAQNPVFWRLIYQAQRATEAANGEGGDDSPRAAHLEGGGGSGPGGGGQVDIADQILGSRQGNSVLPFQ